MSVITKTNQVKSFHSDLLQKELNGALDKATILRGQLSALLIRTCSKEVTGRGVASACLEIVFVPSLKPLTLA